MTAFHPLQSLTPSARKFHEEIPLSLYLSIRRWVDLRLAGGLITDWNLLVLVGVLPAFGVAIFGKWWWIPSGLFLASWVGFVIWRAWRMFKTGLVDTDKSEVPAQK
jgi:hypothetical protein